MEIGRTASNTMLVIKYPVEACSHAPRRRIFSLFFWFLFFVLFFSRNNTPQGTNAGRISTKVKPVWKRERKYTKRIFRVQGNNKKEQKKRTKKEQKKRKKRTKKKNKRERNEKKKNAPKRPLMQMSGRRWRKLRISILFCRRTRKTENKIKQRRHAEQENPVKPSKTQ